MKLSNVLGRIQGNDGEKTAAAVSTPSVPTEKAASETGARLKAALHEVTAAVATPTEKKASSAPIADLTKLAADTANAEHEALVKEAQLYGAAVADGFMARLAQYDAAAEKVAAQHPAPAVAHVPAHLEKQAADLGYANTMGQLEKLAGAAYSQGFNDTVAQIYKVAHTNFVDGYKHACELITAAR